MERIQIRLKEFQKVSCQDTFQVIFHLHVCKLNVFQMSSEVAVNSQQSDRHHLL